jgi:hypothetical protein
MPLRWPPGRKARPYLGLVAISGAFGLVAQWFARRGDWTGAAVASGLGLLVAFYVVFRLWRFLPRPAWSYQVTRHGGLYVLAIVAVAFGALTAANNLLFLILACMLAALVVSGMFSRLNLADLELQFCVPEDIFAEQEVPVRLTLRNAKSWIPSFAIKLEIDLDLDKEPPVVCFPMLAGGQTCSTLVSLTFPQRGRYHQEAFWLRSGFPLGFLHRSARLEMPREIIVYPPVAPRQDLEDTLPQLANAWERYRAGLGQELYRIRPYLAGDSSRIVHWKASAHTGELKVREFSVEEDRRVELVLDAAIPEAPVWDLRFERAVELCASLAWRLHEMGAVLRFQPDELENIYDILRYLALVESAVGAEPLEVKPSGMFQVVFTAYPDRLAAALPESSYYCYPLESL